jgi:hypothetical protein
MNRGSDRIHSLNRTLRLWLTYTSPATRVPIYMLRLELYAISDPRSGAKAPPDWYLETFYPEYSLSLPASSSR